MSLPPSGRHPAPTPQPAPAMLPAGPAAPAGGQQALPHTQTPPQLRQAEPAVDPRGVKRDREDDDVIVIGGSQLPVNKRARTDAADQSASLSDVQRAMLDALNSGDADKLSALLERSPDMVNIMLPAKDAPASNIWFTPLMYAVLKRKARMVDLLIRAGSSVNASLSDMTALKYAAAVGDAETIDLLIRNGADINFIPYIYGRSVRSALGMAVKFRQLQASIYLIEHGADLEKNYLAVTTQTPERKPNPSCTPLGEAILLGFAELIDWLLKAGRLKPDMVFRSAQLSIFDAALQSAPLSVVQMLIEHGANLDAEFRDSDGSVSKGVWQIAECFKRFDVFEFLLQRNLQPTRLRPGGLDVDAKRFLDMMNHRPQLIGELQASADGFADPHYRAKPESMIHALTMHALEVKNESDRFSPGPLAANGLSIFFGSKLQGRIDLKGCQALLGRNPWKPHNENDQIQLTPAQGINAFTEVVSTVCHAPETIRPFSACNLTAEGEAAMNRMIDLQRELLLKGVGHCRSQFAAQVATLPDIAMNRFISLSGRLNQRDLYRVLTKEWGMYDPLARGAIRLVEVAYQKLCAEPESAMPPSFAELPPAARLTSVMTDTLKEWDKIDEMYAAFRQAKDEEQLGLLADLLFEQWRQFCAVFGVHEGAWVPSTPFEPSTPLEPSSAASTSSGSSSAASSDSASSKMT